jgi:hypothetical protein
MFVVKGKNVAILGERAQCIEIVRRANVRVRSDQRGTIRGVGRKHAEPDTQRDRRLVGHPSQLAPTHHTYYAHHAYHAHHDQAAAGDATITV